MTASIRFRAPETTDGTRVHDLIARCPPLDTNSLYCNLLQCTHFAGTSIVAERAGTLAGFIAGYFRPDQPQSLFVWQIAVAPECRGQGLAVAMMLRLLARDSISTTKYLEASITQANHPSWKSFSALARSLGTEMRAVPWLSRLQHFSSRHASEYLIRIGPIARQDDIRRIREAHR